MATIDNESSGSMTSGSPFRGGGAAKSRTNNTTTTGSRKFKAPQQSLIPPSALAHNQRHEEADAKASVAHEYRQELYVKHQHQQETIQQERHQKSLSRMERHSKRRQELSSLVSQLGQDRESRADMNHRRAAANKQFITASGNLSRSGAREGKAERARAVRERLEQHGAYVQAMLQELESGEASRAAEKDREVLRQQNAANPARNDQQRKKAEQQRLWALLVKQQRQEDGEENLRKRRERGDDNTCLLLGVSDETEGEEEDSSKNASFLPPAPRVATRDHRLLRGTTPSNKNPPLLSGSGGRATSTSPQLRQQRLTLIQRTKVLPPLPTIKQLEAAEEEDRSMEGNREEEEKHHHEGHEGQGESYLQLQDRPPHQSGGGVDSDSQAHRDRLVSEVEQEEEEAPPSAPTATDDPDLPTGGGARGRRGQANSETSNVTHQPNDDSTSGGGGTRQPQSINQRSPPPPPSGSRPINPVIGRTMTIHELNRKREERAMIRRVIAIAEQRTMGGGSAARMLRRSSPQRGPSTMSQMGGGDNNAMSSPVQRKSQLVGRSRAGLAPPLNSRMKDKKKKRSGGAVDGGDDDIGEGRYLSQFRSKWAAATVCAQHWCDLYGNHDDSPTTRSSSPQEEQEVVEEERTAPEVKEEEVVHHQEGEGEDTNINNEHQLGDDVDGEGDLSDGALGIAADDGASSTVDSSFSARTTGEDEVRKSEPPHKEDEQLDTSDDRPATVIAATGADAGENEAARMATTTSHGQRSNASSRAGRGAPGSRGSAMVEGDEFDIPPGQRFDDIGGSSSSDGEDDDEESSEDTSLQRSGDRDGLDVALVEDQRRVSEDQMSPTRVSAQRAIFEVLGDDEGSSLAATQGDVSGDQTEAALQPTFTTATPGERMKPSVMVRVIRIQRYWRSVGLFKARVRRIVKADAQSKEAEGRGKPLSVPPSILAQVLRIQHQVREESAYPLSVDPTLAMKIALIQRAGATKISNKSNGNTHYHYRNSNRPKLLGGSDHTGGQQHTPIVSVSILKFIIRLQRFWRSAAGRIRAVVKLHRDRQEHLSHQEATSASPSPPAAATSTKVSETQQHEEEEHDSSGLAPPIPLPAGSVATCASPTQPNENTTSQILPEPLHAIAGGVNSASPSLSKKEEEKEEEEAMINLSPNSTRPADGEEEAVAGMSVTEENPEGEDANYSEDADDDVNLDEVPTTTATATATHAGAPLTPSEVQVVDEEEQGDGSLVEDATYSDDDEEQQYEEDLEDEAQPPGAAAPNSTHDVNDVDDLEDEYSNDDDDVSDSEFPGDGSARVANDAIISNEIKDDDDDDAESEDEYAEEDFD